MSELNGKDPIKTYLNLFDPKIQILSREGFNYQNHSPLLFIITRRHVNGSFMLTKIDSPDALCMFISLLFELQPEIIFYCHEETPYFGLLYCSVQC